MEHPRYQLGIDLGTTYTAAAVCRAGRNARPRPSPSPPRAAAVASVVFLAPDGTLLVGEPAQRRALSEPRRVVREFKRRIGDGTPLVVGGVAVPADAISARFVAWVVEEVARREGGPASAIAVTHPVEWGDHKRRLLRRGAGGRRACPTSLFLTEPQAAAIGYASAERIAPGPPSRSTTSAAAPSTPPSSARPRRLVPAAGPAHRHRTARRGRLRRRDLRPRARRARRRLGRASTPTTRRVHTAVAGLRRECTAAKETLSADTEVMIPVLLPGLHTMVRLGRAEFEDMIRPAIVETVEALRRAIDLAQGRPDDLDAVLLVGGSSRIPLVSQLVSAELGRPISVDTDPKAVVAAGAALAARGLQAPEAAGPGVDDAWLDAAPTGPSRCVADLVGPPGAGGAEPSPQARPAGHRGGRASRPPSPLGDRRGRVRPVQDAEPSRSSAPPPRRARGPRRRRPVDRHRDRPGEPHRHRRGHRRRP